MSACDRTEAYVWRVSISTPRPTPVILVLGLDYREAMVAELSKRYAADYEIVAPTTMEEVKERLTALQREEQPIALAACEYFGEGEKATHILAKLQHFMPSARRLVYIPEPYFRGASERLRSSMADGSSSSACSMTVALVDGTSSGGAP